MNVGVSALTNRRRPAIVAALNNLFHRRFHRIRPSAMSKAVRPFSRSCRTSSSPSVTALVTFRIGDWRVALRAGAPAASVMSHTESPAPAITPVLHAATHEISPDGYSSGTVSIVPVAAFTRCSGAFGDDTYTNGPRVARNTGSNAPGISSSRQISRPDI